MDHDSLGPDASNPFLSIARIFLGHFGWATSNYSTPVCLKLDRSLTNYQLGPLGCHLRLLILFPERFSLSLSQTQGHRHLTPCPCISFIHVPGLDTIAIYSPHSPCSPLLPSHRNSFIACKPSHHPPLPAFK
jgi:hypothetical protein